MAKTNKNTKLNFKEMKEAELLKELPLLKESLRVLHFKAEGSKSKNVKEYQFLKKQIARIMTELSKNKKK